MLNKYTFSFERSGLICDSLFGTNIAIGIFPGKIYQQGTPTATTEQFKERNYSAYHNFHVT
jgi:hypothetical protein